MASHSTRTRSQQNWLIDFFIREDSKLFKLRFVNANDYHGCAYWYLIDVNSGSSGIASYLAVYPYPIKEFIISEFGSSGDSNIYVSY